MGDSLIICIIRINSYHSFIKVSFLCRVLLHSLHLASIIFFLLDCLCLLLSVVGECAPLQTVVSGRSGETSCVGDTVTYTCTISASSHTWMISSLANPASVSIGARTVNIPPYSIEVTSDNGVNMVTGSRLTVTSFAGLDGVNITCFDATTLNGVVQETTAMVFGKLIAQLPEFEGIIRLHPP